MPPKKEFKINEYITLKLERGQTNIYVKDQQFYHCKYLLLDIPIENVREFDDIDSIDDVADLLGWAEEGQQGINNYSIDPTTEFWGHCSNIQTWVENNYDTRILHSNLSFPLLEVLKNAGDPKAAHIYKEELIKRLKNPSRSVINLFMEKRLFDHFNNEEMKVLLEDSPDIFRDIYEKVHPESLEYILSRLRKISPNIFLVFVENYMWELIEKEELDDLSYFFYNINLKDELKLIIKNPKLNIVSFILKEYDLESEFSWSFFEDSRKYANLELKEVIIKILMKGEYMLFWKLKELGLIDLIQNDDIEKLIYTQNPSLLDLLLDGDLKFIYYEFIEFFYEKRDLFLEKSVKNIVINKLKEGKLRNLINLLAFQWLLDFEESELRFIIFDKKIRFYDKLDFFFNELPNEYFIDYNEKERVFQAIDFFCNIFHKILTQIDKESFLLFFRKLMPQKRQYVIEFLHYLGGDGHFFTDEKIGRELLTRLTEDKNLEGLNYVKYNEGIYLLEGNTLDLRNLGIDNIKRILWFEKQNLQELNLSNNPIRKIDGIEKLTNLRKLILKNCHIEEITGLDSLENLEYLILTNNNIKIIKGLENLKKLKELILENNSINEITGLDKLENLEILNLSNLNRNIQYNKIIEIKGLSELNRLGVLNLGQNQISEIKGIENLRNLEELVLKTNYISIIKNLNHLKNLKKLNLERNRITEISGLEKLSSLEFLTLARNSINNIKGLETLKNLTSLSLSNNKITEIKNLDNLTNLRTLFLENNNILELKNVEKLGNLTYFNFQNNKIPKPTSVDLRNWSAVEYSRQKNINPNQYVEVRGKKYEVILGTLFIRNANIRDISEITGLAQIKGLLILDLSGNQISKIKNLKSLKNLRRLDLGRNRIKKIEGIGSLENLESLDLSTNNIRKIEGLDNLRNLTLLWLVDNKISKIEGLEKLEKLKIIHLGDNKISLIEGFESLINLKSLLITSNQIEKIQGLEKLINLEEISLYQNKITKIGGLEFQKKLRSLTLARNKITKIEGIVHLKYLKTFSPGLYGIDKIPFKSYGRLGRKYVGYCLRSIGVNKEMGVIQCPYRNCDSYLYKEWEYCPNCGRNIIRMENNL